MNWQGLAFGLLWHNVHTLGGQGSLILKLTCNNFLVCCVVKDCDAMLTFSGMIIYWRAFAMGWDGHTYFQVTLKIMELELI